MNEIFMITNKSSGPAANCSQTFMNQEGMEEKHREAIRTLGQLQARRKLVQTLHLCAKSVPIHKKNHAYEEKRWITMDAHSTDGGDLAVSVSKMVTTMLSTL